MEQAGLTDFRGSHVLPLVLEVLDDAGVTPTDPRVAGALAKLRDWESGWLTPGDGPLRRDGDNDGDYDQGSAVAIMDALWAPLIREMFKDPVLPGGPGAVPVGFDNAPNSGGSAYQGGFYGFVWSDLARVLGRSLNSPMSQTYCGATVRGVDGTLAQCAQRIEAALVTAVDALEESSGSADPDDWNADNEAERIAFLPAAFLTMHWVNRPTTQHLASFGT